MSLQSTDVYHGHKRRTDRKSDYGFILVLICAALALVVAGVVLTPAPIGSGISSDMVVVGP